MLVLSVLSSSRSIRRSIHRMELKISRLLLYFSQKNKVFTPWLELPRNFKWTNRKIAYPMRTSRKLPKQKTYEAITLMKRILCRGLLQSFPTVCSYQGDTHHHDFHHFSFNGLKAGLPQLFVFIFLLFLERWESLKR